MDMLHEDERWLRRAGHVVVVFGIASVIALSAILFASCLPIPVHAQGQPGTLGPAGRSYYWQGGPAIRLYDGGTGAHSIAEARSNLEVPWINGYQDIPGSWNMTGSLVLPLTVATDSSFIIQSHVDTSASLKWELGGISAGNQVRWFPQDFSGHVAIIDGSLTQDWRNSNFFHSGVWVHSALVISNLDDFSTANEIYSLATTIRQDTLQDKDGRIAMTSDVPSFSTTKTALLAAANAWTGTNDFSNEVSVGNGAAFNIWNASSSHTAQIVPAAFSADRFDTLANSSGQFVLRKNARDFLMLGANLSSTTICTPVAAGVFRVTVYGLVTTILGGAVTVTVAWTDASGAQTAVQTFGLAAGGPPLTINQPAQVASGSVTISTSGYVSGAYSLYTRCEGPL